MLIIAVQCARGTVQINAARPADRWTNFRPWVGWAAEGVFGGRVAKQNFYLLIKIGGLESELKPKQLHDLIPVNDNDAKDEANDKPNQRGPTGPLKLHAFPFFA